MHRGWTKRWRKRWDKQTHRDPLLWVLQDYFIDHANYQDGEVYVPGAGAIHLKRGQHLFGTLSLAEIFRVDRGQIRVRLKNLSEMGFLTITTTNRYSIATIINYETYQSSEPAVHQQKSQPSTSRPPAVHHTEEVKQLRSEEDPPLPLP